MPEAGGSDAPASTFRFPWRPIIGAAVLAAVTYAVFLAVADVRSLASEAARLEPTKVAVVLLFVLGGYLLRGIRWHVYLRHLGVESRVVPGTLTFVSGFALGITPGKFGELVRIHYAREHLGATYGRAVSASVADRVMDIVSVAALFATGFLFVPIFGGYVGALILGGALVVVLALRSERLGLLLIGWLEHLPVVRRAARPLRQVHEGIRPLLRGRILAQGLLLSLASWGAEVVAVFLLARDLDLSLNLAEAAVVFTGASMAGVLSMLPGGLGVTEGGMVALLLLVNVPLAGASALTLATRLATLWFSVLVGTAAIGALRLTRAASRARPSISS